MLQLESTAVGSTRRVFLALLAAIVLAFGCRQGRDAGNSSAKDRQATVTVLVAASAAAAAEDAARVYGKKASVKIRIVSGPSNGLAQQLLSGAPADIFISASQEWADAIEEDGLVGRQRPLLTNRLVLIVPNGNPAKVVTPLSLVEPQVQRVALAGETVPAGKYADQVLKALDLSERLTSAGKIVRGHDVRVTLSYVERAEVEAGIVYATDAAMVQSVEIVHEFNPDLHAPVVYPIVLMKNLANKSAAVDFFEYLVSEQSAEIWRRYGFEPL